jgi:DNA-binding NtrC family response regulator
VIALEMPPLRHRKEDIPLLIEHFFQQQPDVSTTARDMPPELLERLQAYHWPGNVRELFNELRRYVTTGSVELNGEPPASSNTSASEQIVIHPAGRPVQTVVDELEQRLIETALRQHSGNKMQTAKTLHMPLRTLHRKIKKYEME